MADLCMTEADFRAYLDAFNRDDYSGFRKYYADDVLLVLGGKRELKGAETIIEFYRGVKGKTHRLIAANRVIIGVDGIAAELASTFTALEDVPDLLAVPLKKGESYSHVTFALYDVKDGKFTRIRSARYWSDAD
jgi:ketosteroid isomerase-like protein